MRPLKTKVRLRAYPLIVFLQSEFYFSLRNTLFMFSKMSFMVEFLRFIDLIVYMELLIYIFVKKLIKKVC
jgi:hypothetical protein